jgi:Rrf2 family protein
MLSLTCKAAIKAVIYLGLQLETTVRPGIREIAGQINENEHTVGKLLQKLVKADIIKSRKGPNGGFYITEEQSRQKIIKIVDAIDGEGVFRQCGLGLSQCSETHPCPLHNEYKPIRNMFEALCRTRQINELYSPVNTGLAFLVG